MSIIDIIVKYQQILLKIRVKEQCALLRLTGIIIAKLDINASTFLINLLIKGAPICMRARYNHEK